MAKTARKLLLSFMTIAVCIALLVAGTYALFSAEAAVENHLVAGNLSVRLERVKLERVTLGANGHLMKETIDKPTEFTEGTKENLFGIDETSRIAPGCSFTADMVLTNTGSVAFTYWIEVKLKGESNALAQQLKVTVTSGGQTYEQNLSDGLFVGSEAQSLGTVEVEQNAKFSVRVEFRDLDTNNDAKSMRADFDLIVHATQDANIA